MAEKISSDDVDQGRRRLTTSMKPGGIPPPNLQSTRKPMKFLMTYHGDPKAVPTPEKLAELGKFTEEMVKSGVVIMTGGLVRPSKGTKIAFSGGNYSVTDGPFPETKELIDGFALIHADSMAKAIEHAKKFMAVAGEGEGEILQVFDAADL
jgi:hypothetical protein